MTFPAPDIERGEAPWGRYVAMAWPGEGPQVCGFAVLQGPAVFAVADSVGGGATSAMADAYARRGGAIEDEDRDASGRPAVRAVLAVLGEEPGREERPPRMDPLARALWRGHERLLADGLEHPIRAGQTCEAAALRLDEGWTATAHIGRCRVYRCRAGSLEALTDDHSVAVQFGKVDAQAPAAHAQLAYRMLGFEPQFGLDVQYQRAQPGDLLLLCTRDLAARWPRERLQALVADEARSLEERLAALEAGPPGAPRGRFAAAAAVLVQRAA